MEIDSKILNDLVKIQNNGIEARKLYLGVNQQESLAKELSYIKNNNNATLEAIKSGNGKWSGLSIIPVELKDYLAVEGIKMNVIEESVMTISQIKDRKKQLENSIRNLVQAFEIDTRCSVNTIRLEKVNDFRDDSITSMVHVDMKI